MLTYLKYMNVFKLQNQDKLYKIIRMEKVTRVSRRLDMLDTFKNILSTAHTFEEHGLNYNYIQVILKNTANYLKDHFCMQKLKISLSEPHVLKAPDFQNTACFFTISTYHMFIPGKNVKTSPQWVWGEEEEKERSHKITHTIQNLNKPILMIYRTGKPYLDHILLSRKKKKIACIWQKG